MVTVRREPHDDTFSTIGAMKSGTTSLYYLKQHPQACVNPPNLAELPALIPKVYGKLVDVYWEDIARLEGLIGRDLRVVSSGTT